MEISGFFGSGGGKRELFLDVSIEMRREVAAALQTKVA